MKRASRRSNLEFLKEDLYLVVEGEIDEMFVSKIISFFVDIFSKLLAFFKILCYNTYILKGVIDFEKNILIIFNFYFNFFLCRM